MAVPDGETAFSTGDVRRGPERVERAIADIARGRAVIVTGASDRPDTGDLVFAACLASPELIAWAVRHGSGLIAAAADGAALDRLGIAAGDNTAFAVSVDARHGVTKGVSAADRAQTLRVLAAKESRPHDLTSPGHVFPLRSRDGGVLVRRNRIEAAVDLVAAARLPRVGALTELIGPDGGFESLSRIRYFADHHGISMITVDDLARFRWRTETLVEQLARTRLPTKYGEFIIHGYQIAAGGPAHVALVHGVLPAPGDEPLLTRVHVENPARDLFGGRPNDVTVALDTIARQGRGVLVYLRTRGTERTDPAPWPTDLEPVAAQILRSLGVRTVRLLLRRGENPPHLEEFGVEVDGIVTST